MKNFGRVAHTAYGMLVFIVSFLSLMPFFMVAVQKKSWHPFGHWLNSFWSRIYFLLCGIKVEVVMEEPLEQGRSYMFCANHFSYIDIPLMLLSSARPVFVGKSSIGKVPLFGYMYRKLHITVDRASAKSRYETILRARKAVEEGHSLAIFPEGGIVSKKPPQMGRFKDGAFRVAIEKQIPVIPVTFPYNWILLPNKKPLVLHRGKAKVIFHAPISTQGMTLDDLPDLKARTFEVIDQELKKYFTDENRFAYA